jgi:hypothetical protein
MCAARCGPPATLNQAQPLTESLSALRCVGSPARWLAQQA